jgi:Spy/CpxP family protein refolding chaperone
MKRKLMVTGIVVGVAVIALGTVALAHGRCGGDRRGEKGGKHDGIGRMMEGLDLTADQRGKIGKLREELAAKAKPLEQKLHDLKTQERAAWRSDKPDEAKVVALHREVLTTRGGLDELRIAQRFDVMELLTPAQRAELGKRHEGRREKGFGRERDRGERTR